MTPEPRPRPVSIWTTLGLRIRATAAIGSSPAGSGAACAGADAVGMPAPAGTVVPESRRSTSRVITEPERTSSSAAMVMISARAGPPRRGGGPPEPGGTQDGRAPAGSPQTGVVGAPGCPTTGVVGAPGCPTTAAPHRGRSVVAGSSPQASEPAPGGAGAPERSGLVPVSEPGAGAAPFGSFGGVAIAKVL